MYELGDCLFRIVPFLFKSQDRKDEEVDIYFICVLRSLLPLAAIAGSATGRMNPEGKEWISFPGLVLLPVLAVNLCLFLMWCVFRSHWCWVPLAALLLNWEF